MKEEKRFYSYEEAAMKLKISKERLFEILIDSGLCYYGQGKKKGINDQPMAYKRYSKPLKINITRPEQGYFMRRRKQLKDGSFLYTTYITESCLEYLKTIVH